MLSVGQGWGVCVAYALEIAAASRVLTHGLLAKLAALGIAQLVCLFISSTAAAQEPAAHPPKATWLGLTAGLPVPVGGVLGLQLHQRFGDVEFAEAGISTSLLLSGAYLTWGHHVSDSTYTLLGVDASYMAWSLVGEEPFGPSLWRPDRPAGRYFPGLHAGYGTEWWTESTRWSLAICVGLPWLGGLRLGVAL